MNWAKHGIPDVCRSTVRVLTLVAVAAQAGWAAKIEGNLEVILMAALYRGDAKLAADALESGANPNAQNSDGVTALAMAVLHTDADTARKLIERGADVNGRTGLGRTPLIAAASVPGNWKMVKLLLEKGADPNIASNGKGGVVPGLPGGGETPLTEAAKCLDAKSLEWLLNYGAKVEAADNMGHTALHWAALYGNRTGVRLLLEKKPPVKALGMFGTPLHVASARNDVEIARMLIDAGADVNQADRGGFTALMWASFSESGNPALVDLLLRAGANPNVRSMSGVTPMKWAKRNGATLIVDRLSKSGAKDDGVEPVAVPLHDRPLPVKEAMERAMAALQKSSPEFSKVSGCFSCHHQTLPGSAATMAIARGVPVDRAVLDKDLKRVTGFMRPTRTVLIENTDQLPSTPITGSYVLWFLSDMGQPADAVAEAIARNIALHQQTDGRWVGWAPRPPLESGDFQATALAIRTLKLHAPENRRREYEERVARAARWLGSAVPETDHERAYQLLGLAWADASRDAVDRVAGQILARQRPDGGWGQLRTLPSDAYATGQALYALHTAGAISTGGEVYKRGADYLLRTQFEDGSWLVKTRSFPLQPLKDSKFPHGNDQWISAAGTSWAVMALALTGDPVRYTRAAH